MNPRSCGGGGGAGAGGEEAGGGAGAAAAPDRGPVRGLSEFSGCAEEAVRERGMGAAREADRLLPAAGCTETKRKVGIIIAEHILVPKTDMANLRFGTFIQSEAAEQSSQSLQIKPWEDLGCPGSLTGKSIAQRVSDPSYAEDVGRPGKATLKDWVAEAVDEHNSHGMKAHARRGNKLKRSFVEVVQGVSATARKNSASGPHQKHTTNDPFESGYNLDCFFKEDPEIKSERNDIAYSFAKFCMQRSKSLLGKRRFELCHICFFELGKVTPVLKDQMPSHCEKCHTTHGFICEKKGCHIRTATLADTGLHQFYCHEQKSKEWWLTYLEEHPEK